MRIFNPRTLAVQTNFNAPGNGGAAVTTEQYRNLRTQENLLSLQMENLLTRFNLCNRKVNALYTLKCPDYGYAYGNGVLELKDALEGAILIEVDPALAGQTLYVQLLNGSGFTETSAEVSESGVVPVALFAAEGESLLYVTTQDYAFPPDGNGGHGELNGVYVNLHTDENGLTAFDSVSLTNGVFASARYSLDSERADMRLSEIPDDKILAALGKGVRYVVTDNPAEASASGSALYMKKDGYPYGTLENPAYVYVSYPNPDCRVYYTAEYYELKE